MSTLTIIHNTPWFPRLAAVMDQDQALLDRLANEADAPGPDTSDAEFLSTFLKPAVVTSQLAGGTSAVPFRTALWLMFIQGFWSGVGLQAQLAQFGDAQGDMVKEASRKRELTDDEFVMVHDLLAPIHAALAGTSDDQFAALDAIVRLETFWGCIYGAAYNIGFFGHALVAAPEGSRPEHIDVHDDYVTCRADRFLDIGYREPTPDWLVAARQRFDDAKAAHPDRWAEILAGHGGSPLPEIWANGYRQSSTNWGGDSLEAWSQDAYDDMLRSTAAYGMQSEAVCMNALTVLLTRDPAEVSAALELAIIYAPSWLGTAVGMGAQGAEPPRIERA